MNDLDELNKIDDPIVAEVRQQRAAILNAFGGDFEKMSGDDWCKTFKS